MHTAFGKSSDTKDLTFVKIKVQVLDLPFTVTFFAERTTSSDTFSP